MSLMSLQKSWLVRLFFLGFLVDLCISTEVTVWVDEDVPTQCHFNDFSQNATFCFIPSTKPIVLEKLASPYQPYIVKFLRSYSWASMFYSFLETTFVNFQILDSLIPSFLVSWSELRVFLKSDALNEIDISQHDRGHGFVCRWVVYLHSDTNFKESMPDLFTDTISLLALLARCKSSEDKISISCDNSLPEMCSIKISPYYQPCVTISTRNAGVFSTVPDFQLKVLMNRVISVTYLQNALLGTLLFNGASTLSRSRWYHYLVGSTGWIVLSFVLVVYILWKQAKSTFRVLPGSGLIASGGSIAAIIFPASGVLFMNYFKKLLVQAMDILFYMWISESYFGIPHLGKLYFFFFGALGAYFVWWYQWCANGKDDDEDEDNGFQLTPSQTKLMWITKLGALYLLMNSASNMESAFLITLLACFYPIIETIWFHLYYWYYSERPGRYTELISKTSYDEEAKSYTERELKKLQAYLVANPLEEEKVKEENEIRLRRFAHGRYHLQCDDTEIVEDISPPSGWFSCSIQ